jgi:hypothetical protein
MMATNIKNIFFPKTSGTDIKFNAIELPSADLSPKLLEEQIIVED